MTNKPSVLSRQDDHHREYEIPNNSSDDQSHFALCMCKGQSKHLACCAKNTSLLFPDAIVGSDGEDLKISPRSSLNRLPVHQERSNNCGLQRLYLA